MAGRVVVGFLTVATTTRITGCRYKKEEELCLSVIGQGLRSSVPRKSWLTIIRDNPYGGLGTGEAEWVISPTLFHDPDHLVGRGAGGAP